MEIKEEPHFMVEDDVLAEKNSEFVHNANKEEEDEQ